MLRLIVKSANDLIDVDFGPSNKSDPYVKAVFRGEEKKTDYIKDELNPVWTAEHHNELVWELGTDPVLLSDEILVKVRDWEKILYRRLLGQVVISFKDLLKTKDYIIEQTYTLLDSYNRPLVSTILLRIEYTPSQRTLAYMSDEVDGQVQDEDEETDADEEDEEGKPLGKKRRKKPTRKPKREWSTIKRHYKITVKIHEGRQLTGTNISPVARVTVQNQKHETRVKRSTNSPIFKQTFTFNFHCSEAELFQELITLEVFNSRKVFKDSLIGFFESDVGAIYEFPDHAIIRKWVLLTGSGLQDDDDDDDESKVSKWLRRRGHDGGTAGYLKVTINVLAAGDQALSLKQLDTKSEDEDDVESNCLMPAGVTREPAEFHLKVYLAEDLPQMDAGYASSFRKLFLPGHSREDPSERKKLVDPFLVFSFSGKEVKTVTKYKQNNPTYNQLLKLPFLYPTMSERLKFQLFDKDRGNKNDVIGTSFLSLSEISGKDYSSAFLPHFGPCYINFYGSPREYHVFRSKEFDKLNRGIGEGVAYRGRVLVELTQEKDSGDSRPSLSNLHDEDIIRVQPFLRQEKYKMFACFKNAAMISRIDKPIEFEVSIGNFGNALDETEVSCYTPPANPVYDGCHYHYLPWHHYKPCICLNCHWENNAFRIEPLNIINNLCEYLDSKIKNLKKDLEHTEGEDLRVTLVRPCLQEIVEKCRNTKFLKLSGHKNTLDLKLSKLRQDEFAFIVQCAIDWTKKIVAQEQPDTIDVDRIVQDMEDYVVRLKSLAFEPQISIPDVIIWMLCGGNRMAYHRIPIQDVLYSPNKDARGKHCGKTIELLMKYPGKTKFDKEYHEVPAMVRVELWVGLREYQNDWTTRDVQKGEGTFEIFAETYENEIKAPILGWSKPRLTLRPHFSNASGDVPLEKEKFVVPSKGWTFKGEWKAVLDRSLLYDRDWGLSTYTDEIYEHQNRNLLGGEWSRNESTWTEEDGQPSRSIEDFQVRHGWRWTMDKWHVDEDRAVDADGWEYCISEGLGGIYVKAAKPIHMARRRRWVRTRELVDASEDNIKDQERIEQLVKEGWEYAASFQSKFHIIPRSRDFVRRKRLFKDIVPAERKGADQLPPMLAISTKIKRHKTKKPKSKDSDPETEGRESTEGEREGLLAVLPRMFIVHENPRKFQLWVYIYQARDLLAMDDSGRSDPYVRVAFCNQSQKTEWIYQKLSPKWDQTLVFPQVELFETIENVERSPPNIIMEAFDRDPVGKHDFVGRCMMQPVVQIQETGSPPVLTWITLYNGQTNAGQILAAAELFLDEGQRLPALPKPKSSKRSHYIYPVRHCIRPQVQTVAVEILCWGVRNMKKFNHLSIDHPSVEFEWGDRIFNSETIHDAKKNPNFKNPNLTREIVKLEEEPFTPAMCVRVYDNRAFRQKPLVGLITISSLEMSKLQPLSETGDYEEPVSSFSPLRETRTRKIEEHKKKREEFDWWSKYHYSMSRTTAKRNTRQESKLLSMFTSEDETAKDHLDIYEEKKFDSLEIFHCELEKVERFEGLHDFVQTLELKRGKWKGEEEDEDDIVGELKASIRVYQVDEESQDRLPKGMFDDLSELKMKWPIKCLVRVYVICAFQLQPHDSTGLADPYLVVSLGGITKCDKENGQNNTLEPQFGRIFEFNASIPIAKDLKIEVMDNDPGFDDFIGETSIDLEQRLLSRLHASCGLQKTYLVGGPFAWRDSLRPKDILKNYCLAKGYHPFFYPRGVSPNTLVLKVTPSRPGVHDLTFKLTEMENFEPDREDAGSVDQQLSLYALHCIGLVPEHVETRSLYNSLQPGIEQGKLQLWVDIFPKTGINAEIKPPVEIKPRTPQPYVLRVIIWDTTDVELQETSTMTGEQMSDIYIRGWIQDINDKQKTDIHYRSLDGDGNFNWRMCFPFMIMPIEKKLVISKKEKFYHRHETVQKVDPILKIQIWENDKFSPDDFLGTRSLRLNDLVRPCKSSKSCGAKNDPGLRRMRPDDYVDLFHGGSKSVRGWYACWKDETQMTNEPTGKVDLSIEILTEAEANANPAGLGRDEPNQYPHLPDPDRPKTSFLWFASPFKSLRYIVWRNYKWYIIGFVVIVLLALLIVLFVYNIPGYSVKKLFQV